MKYCALLWLALLHTSVVAWADGIPFDKETGKVTERHVRLKLTETQQAELGQHRTITLTTSQHRKLRHLCAAFPVKITEVLSHRYGDCTCCVGHPYAILLPGKEAIAIPHSETDFVSRHGMRERPAFTPAATPAKRSGWNRFWHRVFRRT